MHVIVDKPSLTNAWHLYINKCNDKFYVMARSYRKEPGDYLWPYMVSRKSVLHTGSFEHKMDGLAGYDSSSSTEDDKIHRKLAPKEVRNVRLTCIYMLTLFFYYHYVVLLRRKGGICADLYQMHNSWCCILWWMHRPWLSFAAKENVLS